MTASEYPDRDSEVLFQLARDRLNNQLVAIDALDGKIGLLFGLASGLLATLAAVMALRTADGEPVSGWLLLVLVVAALVYLKVVYSGVNAYLVRSWNVGSELREVWDDLWRLGEAHAKWRATRQIWADYESNRKALLKKERALDFMFAGVIVQSLLVALALGLVAAGV
jgi:hypothetical protein